MDLRLRSEGDLPLAPISFIINIIFMYYTSDFCSYLVLDDGMDIDMYRHNIICNAQVKLIAVDIPGS